MRGIQGWTRRGDEYACGGDEAMTTSILKKLHETRQTLALDSAKKARASKIAKSNPFFTRRVYALVLNGVCDTYEEVVSHADR